MSPLWKYFRSNKSLCWPSRALSKILDLCLTFGAGEVPEYEVSFGGDEPVKLFIPFCFADGFH